MKNLYIENYKILKKEIEDDKNKQRYLYSWIRNIDTVKTSILPKVIYRFNTIPPKIPMAFIEIEQTVLQFV